MSEARISSWNEKMGNKDSPGPPKLCTLPPTNESFRENVLRAHLQVAKWYSIDSEDPPNVDNKDYRFKPCILTMSNIEVFVPTYVPEDVPLAPPALLKLQKCTCSTAQSCSKKCGCKSISIPCSVFCACGGGPNCHNK